jgi:RNA polymerase sigma-70 factor (ECF subfamily)
MVQFIFHYTFSPFPALILWKLRFFCSHNGDGMPDSSKEKNLDLFVRLLAKHQGQIYSYILSIVGNYHDSDDILQETASKLWVLFDRYEPGTDFLKWSLSVAFYRVLEYRKKAKLRSKILYSDDFFRQISELAPVHLSRTQEYLEKLKDCMERLQPSDAALIKLRYNQDLPVKEIAARIRKSVRNVYFSLSRIQHLLLKCIDNE